MRLLLTLGLLAPFFTFSQAMIKEVVSAAGEDFVGTNATISWTLGEIEIEAFSSGTYDVVQGFWYGCHHIACWGAVTEYQNDFGINLFPNPTSDKLHINFSEETNDLNLTIQVTSILGEILIEETYLSPMEIILDINSLTPGSYLIVFSSEKGILKNEKIVKL